MQIIVTFVEGTGKNVSSIPRARTRVATGPLRRGEHPTLPTTQQQPLGGIRNSTKSPRQSPGRTRQPSRRQKKGKGNGAKGQGKETGKDKSGQAGQQALAPPPPPPLGRVGGLQSPLDEHARCPQDLQRQLPLRHPQNKS